MIRDNAVRNRQSEPGALTLLFRGPERVPDARALRLGNARAVILDLDERVLAFATRAHGDPGAARLYLALDRAGQRLLSVGDEVHQHLLDLIGVGANRWQQRVELESQ